MVPFPYPEPALFGAGSHPAGAAGLLDQRWNLTLRVFAASHEDWDLLPDLCEVLKQAHLPARATVPVTLIYGQEAVVATPPHSILWLPAGSPI
jgi:hypothetical protein